MDELRLLRAFHEAGHALAAVALGVPVLGVTLAPGGAVAGLTTTTRRCTGRAAGAARLAAVCDEAVVAAAARFAEQIWWDGVSGQAMQAAAPGCPARFTSASVAHDDLIVEQRAADACALAAGDAAGEWVARRLADAAALVAARARDVARVAIELNARGELDGGQVAAVLGRVRL